MTLAPRQPRNPFGRDNTALLFGSVESFFAIMFGPVQHDAHVECWRADKWLTSREAHAAAANLRCSELVDQIVEDNCRKLAERHGFSALNLRAELYRWEHGEFRNFYEAPSRVRQLRHALEIAREHSAARLEAAE